MKKSIVFTCFILLFFVFNGYSQESDPKCPGDSWVKNPESIKQSFKSKGYYILEIKEKVIGEGSPGKVATRDETIALPVGAYDIQVRAFVSNTGDGCLGLACWAEGFDHDHNWCSMHKNEGYDKETGVFKVKLEWRNWSDCDSRKSYGFIAYKKP